MSKKQKNATQKPAQSLFSPQDKKQQTQETIPASPASPQNSENLIQKHFGKPTFKESAKDIIAKKMAEAEAEIITRLYALFDELCFKLMIQAWAARRGYSFHSYRTITIRLASGRPISFRSPMFYKDKILRKRPKKGIGGKSQSKKTKKTRVCRHFGLELLGFFNKISPTLIELCVNMATLCPSFAVAAQVMNDQGIEMPEGLVRTITLGFGERAIPQRILCHADAAYKQPGLRIQVCVDGGRLRERKAKVDKNGKKTRGFSCDWIAPWQLTINIFDAKGKIIKAIQPIMDGCCKDINDFFELVKAHLTQINLAEAEVVVFCADGGAGIWPRFDDLAKELKIKNPKFILDYTHAKQNLEDVITIITTTIKLSQQGIDDLRKLFKKWLYHGQIGKIKEKAIDLLAGRHKGTKRLIKKIDEYFGYHDKFQYASFKEQGLPTGSGAVESAIRRVINLRIKSPGMFWLRDNAEYMIFLRSLVLTHKLPQAIDVTLGDMEKIMAGSLEEELEMVA